MTLSADELIMLLDSADIARDELVMMAEAKGECWCRTTYKESIVRVEMLITKLKKVLDGKEALYV